MPGLGPDREATAGPAPARKAPASILAGAGFAPAQSYARTAAKAVVREGRALQGVPEGVRDADAGVVRIMKRYREDGPT